MEKRLVLLGIIGLLLVGLYLFLSFHAVRVIQAHVQKALGPGWTIEQIRIKMTSLSLRGIQFKEPEKKRKLIEIEEVRLYPDLFSFWGNRLRIRKCVLFNPSFYSYRTREGKWIGPWIHDEEGEERKEWNRPTEKRNKKILAVRIDHFRMEKGSIHFDDQKEEASYGQIRLKELELTVKEIEYPPVSSPSPLALQGKMVGQFQTGEVSAKGWVDLKTSDLALSFKMRGIDLREFEPYYRKRVSAKIESGHFNMVAHISLRKRALDIPVTLEVVDLSIGEKGMFFYIPTETLQPLLKAKKNSLKTDLSIKGHLDHPGFHFEEVILREIGFGLAESLGLPVRKMEGDLLKNIKKGEKN